MIYRTGIVQNQLNGWKICVHLCTASVKIWIIYLHLPDKSLTSNTMFIYIYFKTCFKALENKNTAVSLDKMLFQALNTRKSQSSDAREVTHDGTVNCPIWRLVRSYYKFYRTTSHTCISIANTKHPFFSWKKNGNFKTCSGIGCDYCLFSLSRFTYHVQTPMRIESHSCMVVGGIVI